jgi:hypothetical protein
MFNSENIHVKVELNGRELVDTLIENDHVDKARLLKVFHLQGNDEKLLVFKINNKEKKVDFPKITECLDVFVYYDDHTAITKAALEIENNKANNGLTVNFKNIVDSLKRSSKNAFYDKIEIDIKPMNCKY